MKRKAVTGHSPFPTRDQIMEFVRDAGHQTSRREIARAFHLDADQRIELRRVLKEMEHDGAIERTRGRRIAEPGELPSVAVIEVTGIDTDGETEARPADWKSGVPPRILVAPDRRSRAAFAPGERLLARLRSVGPNQYEARVIRRLAAPVPRTLGVFTHVGNEGRIQPIDRRARDEYVVQPGDAMDAEPGELVWAEVQAGRPLGLKRARIVERLGPTMGPRSISLITLHDHDIPIPFPAAALREAEAAGPAPMGNREDLRDLPLVTIDGEDARDFDDAVWAAADSAPGNSGGWHIVVAIADVAWYVRTDSALDRAAAERGNSVYFPDRVVPMLPEALSNGWCSLKPKEDRPCLAVDLRIDAEGNLIDHRFMRAMMRSAARLTYRQVQAAADDQPDDVAGVLKDSVIIPLFGAYRALLAARQARGVLELDVPERRVILDDNGTVVRIEVRERFDSHKLIEEFMILANVAAAQALEARRVPCMYRVHDQPTLDKLASLRDFLDTLGLRLAKAGVIRARDFNRILERVAGTPEARLVNEVILRSQAQAVYDPVNIGHFGLALRRYCHFTSPIRRYADLIVHRGLIAALALGEGGETGEPGAMARIAEHISATERRAAAAERDAVDRFTAAFLSERVGSVLKGRIAGVTRFGLFVSLDETGADGLVPISSLPSDYYEHDEAGHRLVGRDHGLTFRLGDEVEVRLVEANPLTGGLIFEMLGGLSRPGRKRTPSRPTNRRSFRKRGR